MPDHGVQGTYLGIPLVRPRAAFFEFSSCEGCQLQILNNESTLIDFLALIDVVNFREAMTERSDDYDIAFVEGSIATLDEISRLRAIRARARTLVALGSCACFGGVNSMANSFRKQHPGVATSALPPASAEHVHRIRDIVPVEVEILGCPVRKEEVERIVMDLVLGKTIIHPRYPVCMECKAHEHTCLFDLGEACLGPVTRAGCDAWCPASRAGCWGCRGPADDANLVQMELIMKERGFSLEEILDRLECFGGFAGYADTLREWSEETGR